VKEGGQGKVKNEDGPKLSLEGGAKRHASREKIDALIGKKKRQKVKRGIGAIEKEVTLTRKQGGDSK